MAEAESEGFGSDSDEDDEIQSAERFKTTGKFKYDGEQKFSFHNFGMHGTPFHELLESMTTLNNMYKRNTSPVENSITKPQSVSPMKKKGKKDTVPNMFSIKDYQKTQSKCHKNRKISQFREAPLKWDISVYPNERIMKELYRTPVADSSGTSIRNLARDEAKGAKPWKAAEFDKDLPPPSIDHCSPTFQKMLLDHMDHVVDQVQKEYEKLPQNTPTENDIKVGVRADLDILIRKRLEIRKQLGKDT